MTGESYDILVIGGQLAGALATLALVQRRPDLRVLLLETGDAPDPGAAWTCLIDEIDPADRWLVEPFAKTWRRYEVRMPRYRRNLSLPVMTLTAKALAAALAEHVPADARISGEVVALDAGGVRLADGRDIRARAVIDARAGTAWPHLQGGWLVSFSQVLGLARTHDIQRPVLIDARVPQRNGFRMMRFVPLGKDRLQASDCYYIETPQIPVKLMRGRLEEYCRFCNWSVESAEGGGVSVLPVFSEGDFEAFSDEVLAGDVARIGPAAGLVQPLTAHELPVAVRIACRLAEQQDCNGPALAQACREWSAAHWRAGKWHRSLVRLMYGAATSKRRYKILERVYRLDHELVRAIHASRPRWWGRVRTFLGKPPIPVRQSISALMGGGWPRPELVPSAAGTPEAADDAADEMLETTSP